MNLAKSDNTEKSNETEEVDNIIIRRYSEIGIIKGFGNVSVEAREGVVLDARHVNYFIRIEASSSGDYPSRSGCAIQIDNVAKIIGALDKLISVTIDRGKFQFTEIEYGYENMKILAFNTANGKLMSAVTIDNVSAQFSDLSSLSQLKALIIRAKEHVGTYRMDRQP